jgi:glycosyltransferase involved in cell wall biosynthesis
MGEYVETGRNGAVVPPGRPGALAEAIEGVLARSAELGAQGRADVEERFAPGRVAGLVADAFDEAVAQSAS